ncbi:hypothetical protein ACFQ67_01700 [Streptomyces sp. NPDC056488]|uniref:hypothetical protein n=1 Tax=unclassified Streptomyces TaxID=2593676 RepID=UPI0036A86361
MRAATIEEPVSGAAAERTAEALDTPNVHGQKTAVTSFVVGRFITRGLPSTCPATRRARCTTPGQAAEVCARADLAELVAADMSVETNATGTWPSGAVAG